MKITALTKLAKKAKPVAKWFSKHEVTILQVMGVTGIVGGTVLMCKSAVKTSEEVLPELSEELEAIREEKDVTEGGADKEYGKKVAKFYLKAGYSVAKQFAAPVIIEGCAIGCMLLSNRALKQRCAKFAADYAALNLVYNKYRAGVRERFGERVDFELANGIGVGEITETKVVRGKEQTETKVVPVSEIEGHSIYARYFDPAYTEEATRDRSINIMQLKCAQSVANNLLISRSTAQKKGVLLLAEVYELLGYEPTVASYQVGWTHDPYASPDDDSDNYVDFGLSIQTEEIFYRKNDNGDLVPTIILDFNVEPCVLDKADINMPEY